MKTTLAICVLGLLVGACSDTDATRAQRTFDDENQVAVPASSNLEQAENAGYLNATDPESHPQTPGEPMHY